MTAPMPQMSFRAVEVFVTIVEQGSVTGAAKLLGLSPSTVSQQLSNLEASLGTRLIERSARTFMLTSAGDIFLPRAQRILDDVTSARAALTDAAQAPDLTLRIASIEDFDGSVVPAWLAEPSAPLANCRFVVRSGASHENLSALADRSVDIIIAMDTGEVADWVEVHPLITDPYILITAEGVPADLDALARQPMIRYAREQLVARQIEAQLRRTGLSPPRTLEFTGNHGLIATVARTGAWAMTTALGYLVAAGETGVTAHPSPLPAFSRRISLFARRGAFAELPATCAADLMTALRRQVLPSADRRLPFVRNTLRLESEFPNE